MTKPRLDQISYTWPHDKIRMHLSGREQEALDGACTKTPGLKVVVKWTPSKPSYRTYFEVAYRGKFVCTVYGAQTVEALACGIAAVETHYAVPDKTKTIDL